LQLLLVCHPFIRITTPVVTLLARLLQM
jgi:hypothetical protein